MPTRPTNPQVVRRGDVVRITAVQLKILEDRREALEKQLEDAQAEITELVGSSVNRREHDPTRARREVDRDQYKGELAYIELTLAAAEIIPEGGCGSMEVTVGSKVTVEFIEGPSTGEVSTYTITTDSDVKAGYISGVSPLAQAIMGKTCEDEGEYTVKDITYRVKILNIK